MSEVRGNNLFRAIVEDAEPLAAASLAGFLGNLDSAYRELRWLVSHHEAALSALEDYVQSGIAISEEALGAAQQAVSEIWETRSEHEPAQISEILPPMYKYGKSLHEMMCEDDYGLKISWIEMRSPLKIGFLNVVISAIVLAAIFSGGTIDCGSMSVRLPPKGKGIAALRDAFNPQSGEKKAAPRILDHLSN